jgi:flagellar hook-associated protein FlgK
MTTNYSLADGDTDPKQKTVTITTTEQKTTEQKTTVARLEQEYQRKLDRIKEQVDELNSTVDTIEDIESNISELSIDSKPARVDADNVVSKLGL